MINQLMMRGPNKSATTYKGQQWFPRYVGKKFHLVAPGTDVTRCGLPPLRYIVTADVHRHIRAEQVCGRCCKDPEAFVAAREERS